MPIHWDIDPFKLSSELDLLKKNDKKVLFIIPTLLDKGRIHNSQFLTVVRYAIIFEDMEEK